MDRADTLTLQEMREEVRKVLLHSTLAHLADTIAGLVLPSIRLTTTIAEDDELPLGTSKFGGQPDLPSGHDWPHVRADLLLGGYADLNDLESDFTYTAKGVQYPLAFIAQVNMTELVSLDTAHQLPGQGILYFFFDHMWHYEAHGDERYRSWTTIYRPDSEGDRLVRTPYPDKLQTTSRFRTRSLRKQVEATLPSYCPYESETARRSAHATLHMTDDEYATYRCLREDLAQLKKDDEASSPIHRLLGNPEVVQHNMQLDCQLESQGTVAWEVPRVEALIPSAAKWRLLLQIDTDDHGDNFLWGDCGRLYFWIREQDLRERNFDQLWMILQEH